MYIYSYFIYFLITVTNLILKILHFYLGTQNCFYIFALPSPRAAVGIFFSVKVQIVIIIEFGGYVLSVTITQLCNC